MNNNRNILCIDLKSFFASCECIEKHLDPYSTSLVVANPDQGNGAITLAVTPFLKTLGVQSRCRLFEIPKHIKYTIAKPRMNLYVQKSKEVVEIYLKFVAKEDLHIYSIDECFLDVTNYLKLYNKTDYELAKDILNEIYNQTGLTATCGIGPNILLAKVSMDVEAKHNTNNISKWNCEDVEKKLWPITPLSKMWGIGNRMEIKLNKLGIYKVGDLAKYDKNILKDKFGAIGTELWNYANGIDCHSIKDYQKAPKSESYSHSQVLLKDYNGDSVKIIILEMVDFLCEKLRTNNKLTKCIGLGIGYSKNELKEFFHTVKLDNATDSSHELLNCVECIFDRFYEGVPIRKVTIYYTDLVQKENIQLNLFEESNKHQDIDDHVNIVVDRIKLKYGKNSLLKATNLLKDSTAIKQNQK